MKTSNHIKVDDRPAIQVVNDPSFQHARLCISTYCESHMQVLGECNSEACVDTCVDYHSKQVGCTNNVYYSEDETYNSVHRCASSSTLFLNSNCTVGSVSTTAEESFQHFLAQPSESPFLCVLGHRRYSPCHTVSTAPCSSISVQETSQQENVFFEIKERSRGLGDGSSSSDEDDNNGEDKRGIYSSFVAHHHSSNAQHSLQSTRRYKSLSTAVNIPQTSVNTGHLSLRHDNRMREVATKTNAMGMGIMLPTSPIVYSSKGDYRFGDSLAERGPILLDIPNGRNELVMAAHSTQSIPKLYPIVGLRKELPGIALPPPIPLDLPKINLSRKVTSITSHQQVVREQPIRTGYGLGTDLGAIYGSIQKQQTVASVNQPQQQQQASLSQNMDSSDPVSIISRAALFLTAGDYGLMLKVLEILDKHMVLPEDIDMAKEFGQGLANYKNLHYRAAKPCFNALFEKSVNYHSSGNQALASIYLGEIEMSWAKYKDAEKHFTLAVTYYSPDNVAEKFQQTILTKSAVLVKKGQCHRSLSQIREAINAFKMAKEVAELAQEQARGSKLKTAKEDELSALSALGNILQSIGDYEQSFEYYEKSLKLAGELGDHVSVGWAHGNLGNAMLGLDQKDKALDHLMTAFHMSARYEGNPLAVGRTVSNLGNAYQAIGNLLKAKEYCEIALGHAIYGKEFKDALVYGEQARARTLGELVLQKKTKYSDLFSITTPLKIQDIYRTVAIQKVPVIFLSYCVSKLLMWIMVPVNDDIVVKCQSIELIKENLEYSSFERYIRHNLLQFLSKDELHVFRRCAYEQESPFTLLHDVIGIKIIEGLKSVGFSEVTEFIVIPDSVTHLLPFSPLMNKHNWQFFGDKYRIRIVPSFSSLLVMSMTSNPVVEIPGDKSDFLIVGNPTIPPFMYDSVQWNLGRLPYAEKEAISVANIIGTIPVLREQATKQSVLYLLRSAKIIHLATHGSASAGFLAFTSSFPVSKSGLAEKEHILIFPNEIETLNISPALVVLSSCDSVRGQVKAEGVIGMARAFLSAGAHSVLVSLWRVPDESANIFMQFFYQFLVNGLPSLQALQRSMQCLRCFVKYSHYVHWSEFQIIRKEVAFRKNCCPTFPIQSMLGETSIFPSERVKSIEENLLGIKSKTFTDMQVCCLNYIVFEHTVCIGNLITVFFIFVKVISGCTWQ